MQGLKVTRYSNQVILLFISILALSSCNNNETGFIRHRDFNADWFYHIGDLEYAANPGLDDSLWKSVHLPHDWSIEDYPLQDSLHTGPFFKNLPGGSDVAYLRDGIAWYRKKFETPDNLGEKRVILDFDGVQTQMELWVNGAKTGEHVYGYTPFQFDITPDLKAGGEMNVIALKTHNEGENSRWYAGAGIYRPVHISILNPVSIAPWGVQITTPEISGESARISIRVRVDQLPEPGTELLCKVEVIAPEGEITELEPIVLAVEADSNPVIQLSGTIRKPILWSVDQPGLYRAVVMLFTNGRETDRYETRFGIRSIAYSAEDGFLLNGKEILMKGACMHHDNGLLGAAAFPEAEYRRVKIMKNNGYNAIRTSHNPPSSSFLDACDELGMLVIDEAFDHWVKPKRPNDYSNYFREWYEKDIQAMVYRDRNHPCVVMWSIGNEVQERADPSGIEIGKRLIAAVRELDDTRPLSQAVCDFWDNPGKEWDYSAGAFEILDIGGYNYTYKNYESDHQLYPDRIMYGSESFPLHSFENWEMVKKHPYVIGDFVWTGMDYLGESGIGNIRYLDKGEPEGGFLQAWPWYVSWCGDIDILGNKKPQSYYRDVVWGESRLEIMVASPVPEGKTTRISSWGWHDELRSWNWEGSEGQVMKVRVYSSFPEVSLELNGRVVGTRRISPQDSYIAEFEVKYAPGELKAIGKNGELTETLVLTTAKAASKLVLIPEKGSPAVGKNSIAFFRVEARDEEGVLAVNANTELKVEILGEAELLAAGNANPRHDGSFTDGVFELYRGLGLIIVRSMNAPLKINVRVSSADLQSEVLVVDTVSSSY